MKQKPVKCVGSLAFPSNFDGEYTRCDECKRKMNLNPNGLVPEHNTVAALSYVPTSERNRR